LTPETIKAVAYEVEAAYKGKAKTEKIEIA
jgi:hypothetical protein